MTLLLDNWGAIAGIVGAVIMFYRMNLAMQEFSDKEEIVKDPLGFAVKETATFDEFKANSWKAFDAHFAAIRFRTFYKRFRLLIDPFYSQLCMFALVGVFVLLLIELQIMKTDAKINNVIGGVLLSTFAFWWCIVDHGKALKKSVEKLRVQ